jgi:uncharacterized protein (TIGR00369 family)
MDISKLTDAAELAKAIPHAQALGMSFVEIGQGHAIMQLPYDEKLIGDPQTGVIHGGAVFALMDTCAGAAVMSHPDAKGYTATIDLRVDYMRSATPGQILRTRADCYRYGRSVAFVRAVAYDEDEARPVAVANGAFVASKGE